MRTLIAAIALTLSIAGYAAADATKTITLKDGSQIQGQVLSMEDGEYRIKTAALGTITLADDQIVSLSAPGATPVTSAAVTAPTANLTRTDMDAVQSQIVANPMIMQEIAALAADPEIMELISDPAFMQLVQSRDPQAIQANPRAQALMENPKIQALIEKLQGMRQN